MRAVLVTGASKGIGDACVRRLAGGGWRVFAGCRSDADAERLRRIGAEVVPLRLDVTDARQIEEAADTVEGELGERGLDGLVNNAGIAVGGPLEFLPVDALRTQLEVNVIGQVAVTQAFLPLLRRARGRILFIGSIAGRNALPFVGAYAASKFALEAIADALRVELQPFEISVVMIEPGVIATPIWQRSLELGERNLEGAPPELTTYYGRVLDAVRGRVAKGDRGLPPDRVARVVERVLTSARPRTRYLVGSDARLRAAMQAVLPDRMRDALVRRALDRATRATTAGRP